MVSLCVYTFLDDKTNLCYFILNLCYRGFTKMSSQGQYEGGGTKTVSMFSKLVSQGSSFVMEGVKNLVVKKHVS